MRYGGLTIGMDSWRKLLHISACQRNESIKTGQYVHRCKGVVRNERAHLSVIVWPME